MKRKLIYLLLGTTLSLAINGQTGGDNIYEFLNLTYSGLAASLGGTNVSINTDKLNMSWHNPGLLNNGMDKSLSLNYSNYYAGINYGMAMYSASFERTGNFAAGITYLNYGSFTEADPSGNITGSFSASEYAFPVIYSRSFDTLFTVGVTVKPVLSFLEKYSSFGMAFDLGASWHNPSGLFSAGIVMRNAGIEITRYAGEARQKLPFEIEAGVSQKLEHAPFRFSLTLRHLEKYDLTYDYNDTTAVETNEFQSSEFLENMMRHVVAGVELIPHKNFYISAGYNYQRRRELQIETKAAAVGFSWGFGLNTSWFNLEFGRATYHLAGSSNHVSFIIRPGQLYTRNRK